MGGGSTKSLKLLLKFFFGFYLVGSLVLLTLFYYRNNSLYGTDRKKSCLVLEHLEIKYATEPCLTQERVKEVLINLVYNVSYLLTSNNVVHWMDSGTLLGSVRNKGLIPWDEDSDFGILEDGYLTLRDLNVEAHPDFVLSVYRSLIHSPDGRDKNIPVRLIHRTTGLYSDVFVFKRHIQEDHEYLAPRPGVCWNGCRKCEIKNGARFFKLPQSAILPTQQCDFEGRNVSCPNDADLYLKTLFGDKYMRSRSIADWVIDEIRGIQLAISKIEWNP